MKPHSADVRPDSAADDFYRVLTECSDDIIAIHHVDGRRLYISPSYWRVTGWSPEEVQSCDWRKRVHPDDLPAVERAHEANLRGEVTTVEHRALCKDGSWLWIETRCRPLAGADGQIERMVLWSRDISARKVAESRQDALQRELWQSQKMEAIGRLAGGVAHDFNNMLQTILGTTELLLRDLSAEDPRIEDLREIERAAQRSADLTRQLLAFARRQTILPKTLDLSASVSGMFRMLRRVLGEGIELAWAPAPEALMIHMDPSQLDQILANLMIHARDAIQGVGKVEISTRGVALDEAFCHTRPDAVPGDYAVLTVKDSGTALGAEELARIFEPFYGARGDEFGTGLGLATVYGIVKQNRGLIAVSSLAGQGTIFDVYLPRHLQVPASEAKVIQPAAVCGGSLTVLLVEDEPTLLRLTSRLLGSLGYRVISAEGPREALRQSEAYEGVIDLLVTDVIMPDLDGHELLVRLQASRPDLRCLFMSGYPSDAIARCGVLAEGLHLIQKPFTKKVLCEKLNDVFAAG